MIAKLYVLVGYFTSLIGFLLGIVILGSIFNDYSTYLTNGIIGFFIILFSLVFYKRTCAVGILKFNVKFEKFLVYDLIIQICVLLFFILLFSMALYRTFGEKYPVFG